MLNPVNVRIDIRATDCQCMRRKADTRLKPEMNYEHVLKGAFEGIKNSNLVNTLSRVETPHCHLSLGK